MQSMIADRRTMDWRFDVFVSYAHADADFVRVLVGRLREAGVSVWLDEERLPGGVRTEAAIQEGLASSRHLLVVASNAWQGRDWTEYELGVFRDQMHGDQRRIVPLVRMARYAPKSLGPHLAPWKAVAWPPDGSDGDARLWEVLCALTGAAPGPRQQWARRGREACGDVTRGPEPTPAAPRLRAAALARHASAPAVLLCDRSHQWGDVVTRAATPHHQIWFVTGPAREGHAEFLERIRQWLPNDPPRELVSVRWPPRGLTQRVPVDAGEALGHVAERLGCPSDAVVGRLREILAERNLVLLHDPELCGGYERDDLHEYYARIVPDVLARLSADGPLAHGVKFVQALSWTPVSPLSRKLAQLLALLGLGSSAFARERLQSVVARRLVERVTASLRGPASPVAVVPLAELSPLTRGDVRNWLETDGRALAQAAHVDDVEELIRGVFAGDARSHDVLANLMRHLGTMDGG